MYGRDSKGRKVEIKEFEMDDEIALITHAVYVDNGEDVSEAEISRLEDIHYDDIRESVLGSRIDDAMDRLKEGD